MRQGEGGMGFMIYFCFHFFTKRCISVVLFIYLFWNGCGAFMIYFYFGFFTKALALEENDLM